MGGDTLIIILAVALVVAIAVLVVGGGRIAYGIAHYYLKERKPPRTFHSPEFGPMTGEDGTWQGEVTRDGREIPFAVEGTETRPDEQLLEHLRQVLLRFPQEEKRALDFLRQHEPELAGCALELYALCMGDKLAPRDFVFEFISDRNNDRVWRVGYENGEPASSGFDD